MGALVSLQVMEMGGGRCRSGNFKVLSVRKNGAEGSMCANKNKKMKKKEKKTLRRGSVHL